MFNYEFFMDCELFVNEKFNKLPKYEQARKKYKIIFPSQSPTDNEALLNGHFITANTN